MAEGISLHVGVNRLDPGHYVGFGAAQHGRWEGSLRGCEHDANDLQALAATEGFAATTLLTEAGTAQAVATAVREAAATLDDGDMFVLTFSGYGGEVPDKNSDDHWRERTWALYDRQMPEDELTSFLAAFRPGVRVLVIDDASPSGTVRRDVLSFVERPFDDDAPRTRGLPADVTVETYRDNSAFYDELQRSCPSSDEAVIDAAVVTMTGFATGQLAAEGPRNGAFTQEFLRVWDGGRFQGNYRQFAKEIAALMPPTQTPQLAQRGSGKSYVDQRPLTL
jgi:hypothetical protein